MRTVLIFGLILVCSVVKAQLTPSNICTKEQFSVWQGGTFDDVGVSVVPTVDSVCVALGYTNDTAGYGGNDVILTKRDDCISYWSFLYGSIYSEHPTNIIATADEGFVVVGYQIVTASNYDGFVMKVDKFGKLQWTYTFGDSRIDRVFDVVELDNGDLFFTGTLSSVSPNNQQCVLGQLNSVGQLLWMKTIDLSAGEETGSSIVKTHNGFFICGKYNTLNSFVMKIDTSGQPLWVRTLEYPGNFVLSSALHTNSGLICAGHIPQVPNSGVFDVHILAMDSLGSLEWGKNFGGSLMDHRPSLIRPSNSQNFYLAMHSSSYSANGDFDVLLAELDDVGNVMSTASYGETMDEEFVLGESHANLVYDNAIYLNCRSDGFGGGGFDQLLIKVTTPINADSCSNGLISLEDSALALSLDSQMVVAQSTIKTTAVNFSFKENQVNSGEICSSRAFFSSVQPFYECRSASDVVKQSVYDLNGRLIMSSSGKIEWDFISPGVYIKRSDWMCGGQKYSTTTKVMLTR